MNRKAKKYIEDNTLDLNKNERMDTTGYASLVVSIGKAYGAILIAEQNMLHSALDAHKVHCPFRRIDKCYAGEDYKLVGECLGECDYMKCFKTYMEIMNK